MALVVQKKTLGAAGRMQTSPEKAALQNAVQPDIFMLITPKNQSLLVHS
jgi:hypothetical protein